jgi:TatA/E family protein of Tat protein translocase
MFGIGAQELAIILVVALLVFGPKRLPDLARTLGRGLAEFRRASSDLRQSINLELDPEAEEKQRIQRAAASEQAPPAAPPAPQPAAEPTAAESSSESEGAEPAISSPAAEAESSESEPADAEAVASERAKDPAGG